MSMSKTFTTTMALAMLLAMPSGSDAQVVREITPRAIAQAIAYGTKEKNVELYEIKTRSGFAWDKDKVRWGLYSTPFLRVAMAANRAKKQYKPFAAQDVTSEMVAPELHVYATAAALGGMQVANVEAVVVSAAGERDRSKVVHPTGLTELPEEFQNIFGAKIVGKSVLAVFPLDVLSEQNEIHIVFDRRVASGATGCDDCSMRFKLSGVR